jgi:glycosyltransferase 2 family protein
VHRVPLRRVITVAFIGFAAIVVFPFRMGEVVRPVMIRRKGQLSAWAASGTVGAERIIDGLALSISLFLALQIAKPLDPLPDRIGNLPVPTAVVPGAAYAMLLLFMTAFLTMSLFYWRREWARRITERVIGSVSKPLAHWLADRIEQVAGGLRFLPRLSLTVPFLAATAMYWLLNVFCCWLLAWGCGFENITLAQACANMGVLALGILLPNAPGFFGAFQISVYAGFAMYFPPEQVVGPGSAYVFIMYLVQLTLTLVAGGIGMALEHTGLSAALEEENELQGAGDGLSRAAQREARGG